MINTGCECLVSILCFLTISCTLTKLLSATYAHYFWDTLWLLYVIRDVDPPHIIFLIYSHFIFSYDIKLNLLFLVIIIFLSKENVKEELLDTDNLYRYEKNFPGARFPISCKCITVNIWIIWIWYMN